MWTLQIQTCIIIEDTCTYTSTYVDMYLDMFSTQMLTHCSKHQGGQKDLLTNVCAC